MNDSKSLWDEWLWCYRYVRPANGAWFGVSVACSNVWRTIRRRWRYRNR